MSRVGSSGYAFVNGTASGSNPFTWSTNFTLSTPIYISSYDATPSLPARGYISNLRYNIGQGNTSVTIPTSQNRPVSNTVLHCNFTNAGIYDSTAKNVLFLDADSQISTGAANTQFGTGSLSFSTQTTGMTISGGLISFGTGDWTIEFFLKQHSIETYNVIYDHRPDSTQGAYPCIYTNSGVLKYYVSTADRITGPTISAGRWYHVAVVKNSDVTKMYLDGLKVGNDYADTNSYLFTTNRPVLGGHGNLSLGQDGLIGCMDEVRVTKGLARYTANFIPMTAASGNKTS